jgi:hypothetical protein
MLVALFLGWIWVTPTAFADDVVPPAYDQAEYVRLSQELEKLAGRNAWSGVERTYLEIIAIGAQPAAKDHLAGAHAATALGNITAARSRLEAATKLVEDKQILDWLWSIDSGFGRVFVAADKGPKTRLTCDEMPFNPEHRKAVEFAMAEVENTGMFDGYLPQGNYKFGAYSVEVVPRVQSVRIDVRGQQGLKQDLKAERKKRKEAKAQAQSQSPK